MIDVPQAGSITGLVGLLYSIWRFIERKTPARHREELSELVSRIGRAEERNETQRNDVALLDRRLGYAELDILRLKRNRNAD